MGSGDGIQTLIVNGRIDAFPNPQYDRPTSMTSPTITHLHGSRVELKFVVTPEEAKPYLDRAVEEISTTKPIKGFRPGKAGYSDVKSSYGEMLIWETALERIIRAKYVKAILDHNIETVGSPEISVEKLVPNQDIAFTLTASVMPTVTHLADYTSPLVTKKTRTVTEEEVHKALQDLRTLRRSESAVNRTATQEDMIVIDLEIKKDRVPVDGGTSRDYKMYLNEPHYIPGFTKELVGMKKGDVKTFELEFPKDHYNKMLAGNRVEFTAIAQDVFEIQLPEESDEFAKGIGLETLAALKDLLRKNLQEAQNQKCDETAEIELLEKLVKESQFSEIPELLVNEEVRRMVHELEHNTEQRGMKFEDYLTSMKKTVEEIKLAFVPRAIERVQTAVLIKEIGKRENVAVSDEEVEAEQDRLLDALPRGDTETRERVVSPEYRDDLAVQMKNRKILAALKAKGMQTE